MAVSGIDRSSGVNSTQKTYNKRILGKNFNIPIDEMNSGSKTNEPLATFSNPKTGESFEIHRSDVYSEDSPIYILKGTNAKGEAFESKLHAWMIDTRNCSYAELMVLNQEIGNTSQADKQRVDMLFENISEYMAENKPEDMSEGEFKNYFDKADYSAAAKRVLDKLKDSGNWDSYLSMDKWQQSIHDYTSVPVTFDRDLMVRNGVTSSCPFGTVRTAEEILKEIDDRVKAAEKNGPTLREALANHRPNAEKMLYGIVGSSKVMTFDEYVRYMEEELRKLDEKAKASFVG